MPEKPPEGAVFVYTTLKFYLIQNQTQFLILRFVFIILPKDVCLFFAGYHIFSPSFLSGWRFCGFILALDIFGKKQKHRQPLNSKLGKNLNLFGNKSLLFASWVFFSIANPEEV